MKYTGRKILVIIIFVVVFIIAYYLTSSIHNNKLWYSSDYRIAVLDGLLLKNQAKCFKVHDEASKRLNSILQNIKQSETQIKSEYDAIRNNSKLSQKQKQKALLKVEAKWHRISTNYNSEIQSIRSINNKLTKYIQDNLNDILKKLAKSSNLIAILNKETAESIFVFYNTPSIDITNKVIQELDKELKDLNIDSFK